MHVYIGTSGYKYANWKSTYYPKKLGSNDEFSYYMNDFNTVEINNSYYKMPTKENWLNWRNKAQRNFVYSVKANRLIIQSKDPKKLKLYWDKFWKGAKLLETNLGCILFQYPDNFEFNEKNYQVIQYFSQILPKKVKFAFEFRHVSWFNNTVYDFFNKHKWTIVIDHVKNTGWIDDFKNGFNPDLNKFKLTSDYIYIRLHGTEGQYIGGYKRGVLEEIIKFLNKRKPKYAFIYFNNTDKIDKKTKLPDAVHDAKHLVNMIPIKLFNARVVSNVFEHFFEFSDNDY